MWRDPKVRWLSFPPYLLCLPPWLMSQVFLSWWTVMELAKGGPRFYSGKGRSPRSGARPGNAEFVAVCCSGQQNLGWEPAPRGFCSGASADENDDKRDPLVSHWMCMRVRSQMILGRPSVVEVGRRIGPSLVFLLYSFSCFLIPNFYFQIPTWFWISNSIRCTY
jgi:hypothetical protein